ncbi:MAG: hypothetical protein GC185_07710 [Alphaproteobacteria bacterium]|nr:hypothetical protein [Alphaproteobacteria bacterium]
MTGGRAPREDGSIIYPARALDLDGLRQFFLGVMRWPPDTLRRAALSDLYAARAGYLRRFNPQGRVTRRFLDEMLKKFPDGASK